MRLILPLIAVVTLLPFSPASANDVQSKAEALRAQVDKLAEGLKDDQKRHFLTIYGNYNLIKTVETVRGDVGRAVEACGEANPELKDKIAAKFADWKGDVNPVIEEAQSHLDNMVVVQDYLEAQQIHRLFRQIDETRHAVQGQVEKTPVTSAQGCNAMHDKMTETQETMVKLLRSTLVSFPQGLELEKVEEETPEFVEDPDDPMPAEDTPAAADTPEEPEEL